MSPVYRVPLKYLPNAPAHHRVRVQDLALSSQEGGQGEQVAANYGKKRNCEIVAEARTDSSSLDLVNVDTGASCKGEQRGVEIDDNSVEKRLVKLPFEELPRFDKAAREA